MNEKERMYSTDIAYLIGLISTKYEVMKMIKIFFGSDPAIREQLTQQLTTYSVDFQAYEEEELSE